MPSQRNGARATAQWRLRDYAVTLRATDRAEATRTAYLSDLDAFIEWAVERDLARPRDVTMRVLRDYLAFMTERGDERTSIDRKSVV